MPNMKINREKNEDSPVDVKENEYPYGLKLNLDNDSIKKLDLKALPEVGTVMTLTATVEVVDRSESEYTGDKVHKNLGLQITDMELGSTKEKKDMEEELYGVPKDPTKEGKAIYVPMS